MDLQSFLFLGTINGQARVLGPQYVDVCSLSINLMLYLLSSICGSRGPGHALQHWVGWQHEYWYPRPEGAHWGSGAGDISVYSKRVSPWVARSHDNGDCAGEWTLGEGVHGVVLMLTSITVFGTGSFSSFKVSASWICRYWPPALVFRFQSVFLAVFLMRTCLERILMSQNVFGLDLTLEPTELK